ncbi:universal stress protein [Arthrobacter halodurans]|jgi:nucleotide-binding universal stress UspA family protein|uniref:Universal stress protein n=1 Tax=Arthrobacter halodurans TaxID=516699 RepID=A0ABV4URE4_9MICC
MSDSAATSQHVVVGVDGSPQSITALRYGRKLADALGLDLEAFAAWQVHTAFEQYEPTGWDPETEARTGLESTIEEAFGEDRPANLSLRLAMGPSTQQLVDRSKDAAMIVLGTRGRGGFKGMILGSVSANVAAHAKCPVVIAR